MSKHMKILGLVGFLSLIMMGFQNCSEVGFQDTAGASAKGTPVVDLEDIEGVPLDEEVAEEIADRIDDIEGGDEPNVPDVVYEDDKKNNGRGKDGRGGPHQDDGESNDDHQNGKRGQVVMYNGPECGKGPNVKVLICHVPRGNPGNAHTLCISENALWAHVEKGHGHGHSHEDYVGSCDDPVNDNVAEEEEEEEEDEVDNEVDV